MESWSRFWIQTSLKIHKKGDICIGVANISYIEAHQKIDTKKSLLVRYGIAEVRLQK